MLRSFEITHATPDGFDRDRRIDLIGGPANGGWKMTQEDAIAFLKARLGTFYVTGPGAVASLFGGTHRAQNVLAQKIAPRAEVIVVPATWGVREHLTTVADGVRANNLESLPPVPAHYRLVRTL